MPQVYQIIELYRRYPAVETPISCKIESKLGLRQNKIVIKMDVQTRSSCCEAYLGLSDISSPATNQIYLLLRAHLK